jgi:hypothetical protein
LLPRPFDPSLLAKAQGISPVTLWLSSGGLPLQIDFFIPSETNRFAGVHASRKYLKPTMQDGVLVPASEVLSFEGRPVSELIITSISLSGSVNDSYFAEAKAGKKQ